MPKIESGAAEPGIN